MLCVNYFCFIQKKEESDYSEKCVKFRFKYLAIIQNCILLQSESFEQAQKEKEQCLTPAGRNEKLKSTCLQLLILVVFSIK